MLYLKYLITGNYQQSSNKFGYHYCFTKHLLKCLVLPYYRITIWYKSGKVSTGIRASSIGYPEVAHVFFWKKTIAAVNEATIKNFEVALLPKNSAAVMQFLKQNKH